MYSDIFRGVQNEKILVTNSCIIINNYHMGDSPNLEQVFSVWDPITHKKYLEGLHYNADTCRLYLPAGLDLWKIRQYFNERYYKRIQSHPYKKIVGLKMKKAPRDSDQYESLKFMCGLE